MLAVYCDRQIYIQRVLSSKQANVTAEQLREVETQEIKRIVEKAVRARASEQGLQAQFLGYSG